MKKKILLTLGAVALASAAYAGFRCTFCKGTGFQPGTNFTCSFCKGSGHTN